MEHKKAEHVLFIRSSGWAYLTIITVVKNLNVKQKLVETVL